jgi:hypothetical protein
MAEETEIILNVRVDVEDSPNELEKVEQQFGKIETQVDETGEAIAGMTKKIELYKSAALQAGAETPIGKEAIARAAELQGELDKVNELVTRNNTDFDTFRSVVGISQTAINSYGAFQAVSAIVGVENEKLLETMVKLQAAQQLLNSLEGARASLLQKNAVLTKGLAAVQRAYGLAVGTSTGALKLFRLALIATGIGALVVLIGTLIANWKEFVAWIERTIERFEWLQPVVDAFVKQIELVKAGLQALGIVDDEQTARAKANAEARIQNAKDEEAAINSKFDFEIQKAQAAGKETFELEKQKRDALIERIRAEAKAITALAKLNGEVTEEQKERAKELMDEFKRLKEAQVIANIQQEKKLTDEYKKEVDNRAKAGEKAAQEEQKRMDEEIARQDAQFELMEDLRLSAQEKEIRDLVKSYDEKFALAEGNAELEKELMVKQAEEIAEIEQTYADEKLAREADNAMRMRDLRLELKSLNAGELDENASPEEARAFYEARREVEEENFNNQLEDLAIRGEAENLSQEEINLQKEIIEKNKANSIKKIQSDELAFEEKINKAKVESTLAVTQSTIGILGSLSEISGENASLQKTLAIAQIALDTGVGISGAIKAGAGLPFPSNLPAIASGVSTVLAGMVNAKNAVASAKVPNGGGITIPTLPQSFISGGGVDVESPSADFEAPTGTLTGFGTPTEETTTRVTVLESDIQRATQRNEQSVLTSEL